MDSSEYIKIMNNINSDVVYRAKKIKLLVLDVDGVMTDGGIYLSSDNKENKRFYAQDGHGLVILKSLGLKLAILSGRYSQAVEHRGNELGFDYIIQNSRDKLDAYHKTFAQHFNETDVCFVGDDIVDIELIKKVGLGVTVPNANYKGLHETSDWVTPRRGGHGAVRDVCDLIIMAKNET